MNKRTVHLENNPDPGTLALMLAHVGEVYLTHAVEVRREGEPVAVLLEERSRPLRPGHRRPLADPSAPVHARRPGLLA